MIWTIAPSLIGLLFAVPPPAPGQEVSRTFADILSRVIQRDKDSGAILRVNPKADAPQEGKMALSFSMKEHASANDAKVERSVVIELATVAKNRQVYERYLLVMDEKMQAELAKLELLRQQTVEKEKQQAQEQARQIKELTNDKLHRGMTEEEVIAVLGKPQERNLAQAVGNFGLAYENYSLFFRKNRLAEIQPLDRREIRPRD
jgi:hypothetical protein